MKSKKKHTNLDFEVVDGIGKYMDDDIQRIIEGKQLELGDRELPPFDEYRIYKNIQEAVMREEKRKNRRIRMPLFFKWTVACAIVWNWVLNWLMLTAVYLICVSFFRN